MQTLSLICHQKPPLKKPIAVAASPGLRSIGRIALNCLIDATRPELFAGLYSPHFPVLYYSLPTYAADPSAPGDGGILIKERTPILPAVKFHFVSKPELILVEGYHADFKGQYDAAERTLQFCSELGVTRIIVLAGYTQKGESVCCAATSPELLEEMKAEGLGPGYEGPFYGFSGLIFGLSRIYDIGGIALFAQTKPVPENPEEQDLEAVERLLAKLNPLLNLNIPPPPAGKTGAEQPRRSQWVE